MATTPVPPVRYVPIPYPKWVFNWLVRSEEEHQRLFPEHFAQEKAEAAPKSAPKKGKTS